MVCLQQLALLAPTLRPTRWQQSVSTARRRRRRNCRRVGWLVALLTAVFDWNNVLAAYLRAKYRYQCCQSHNSLKQYSYRPNFECIRLLLFYSVIFQSCNFQSCKFSYPNLVYSGDHLQNLIRCFLHEGKYFLNFMTVHPRFQKSFGQTDRMIIPSTSLLRRCNELPEQRRIAVYLETHCPVDYFTVDTLRCRRGTARRCVHLGVICHQLPRSVCTPNLRHLLSPTPKTEGLRSIKRSRDHDRDPFGCK